MKDFGGIVEKREHEYIIQQGYSNHLNVYSIETDATSATYATVLSILLQRPKTIKNLGS